MATVTEAAGRAVIEPDPLDTTPDEVESYVAALKELAPEEPGLAKRRVWSQIRLAGVRARKGRAEAHESLNRIFRLGTPPEPAIEGPTKGILVTPVMPSLLESGVRSLTEAWMPWLGKRFDAEADKGDNLLTASARTPAKALWRSYTPEETGDGRLAAFRFRTYIDPGRLDPDRQTLKIDYDSEENPGFLIRDILDELVEVVPGAYLGKVLLRRNREAPWRLVGYFALET